MVLDGKGARLVGISGSDFSAEDEALLSEIEADSTCSGLVLAPLPQRSKYVEIACKLGDLPDKYRPRVENMVIRLGLESGDLEPLAARLEDVFSRFIYFFADWKNKSGL
jgi:hypothetical protein